MTASYTATITFADYFSGEPQTFSYTGSLAAASVKMDSWKMAVGGEWISASITPTDDTRKSVQEVMAAITAEENAAELVKIRTEGASYHKTYRGAPLPIV